MIVETRENTMDLMSVSFASILTTLVMGGNLGENPQTPQEARVSTYTLPNIAGQWQLVLDKPVNPNCQERYNFARDAKFLGSSGAEFTVGRYLYSQVSDGLPALAVQTQYDNNAVDCSGQQVDQTGDMLLTFVKQEGNVMQWCRDADGKQCPMTLKRVLP